jgi:predicted nucleic acid-binding protein
MTDTVVFDTEPLIAYLDDEPGSDVVEDWIDQVASGEIDGYISPVTKTEVLYVGSRIGFQTDKVRASLKRLEEIGVTVYDPRNCWEAAAAFKEAYLMTLGDAYALATANAVDGTLLVGADNDFDELEDLVERFRDDPA